MRPEASDELAALAALPERLNRFQQQKQADLELLLLQIDHGVSSNEGMDRRLSDLLRRPDVERFNFAAGLPALDRPLVRLRQEREAQARLRPQDSWPRAYRYTGRAGRHTVDGRILWPGDVVELSEEQAHAFRDRFEPVEEDETATGEDELETAEATD